MENNKNKKIFHKKPILRLIVPIILLFFWIICSLAFNNKISFSVLLYSQSNNDIKQLSSEKILKGGKISGEFQAKENYLGLIMLRFNDYVKHDYRSEDILLFKLKEKGTKQWEYVNNYKSGLLENNLLFPFGFPIINESKDKVYEFEVESLLGNDANAVEINKNNLTFLTGYQFPKNEILSGRIPTLKFFIKKSITSFTNLDFLLSSVVYALPLFIYLLIYVFSPWWKKNLSLRYALSSLFIIFIFLDIFFVKETYIGILIATILGWEYCIIKNRLASRINFILAFLLILIWLILIELQINEFQNKINIWVYALFVVGLVHSIIEERKATSKK